MREKIDPILKNGVLYEYQKSVFSSDGKYKTEIFEDKNGNQLFYEKVIYKSKMPYYCKNTLDGKINMFTLALWHLFDNMYYGGDDRMLSQDIKKSKYHFERMKTCFYKYTPDQDFQGLIDEKLETLLNNFKILHPDFDEKPVLKRIFGCQTLEEIEYLKKSISKLIENENEENLGI